MLFPLRLARLAPVAIAALLVAGCSASGPGDDSSDSQDGGTSDGALVVYNAQHEELTTEWADAFTEESGIEVVLRNGDDSELGNQLVQEGAASQADVFLTENSPAMSLVEKAGLLAPVDEATLALVPEQYRPSSGDWTGIAARSTVLVYNPDLISEAELPTSLLDLADPEWKGRWGAAPAKADFQAIVSAVVETQGEDAALEWLEGLATNATEYRNNIVTMKAVSAGEVPVGVIYHYYWYRDQDAAAEDSGNTQLHYFGNQDPGAFVSVSGGGVLKNAPHADEAQQFLAFIAGEQGQEILGEGYSFEYPVASNVQAKSELPPLDGLAAPVIDPSALNGPKVIELMTEAGLL
ncbi:iron ABC transporter substrate-binding protein [Cryobacterium sp. LW097]|uniref:iron ABC transporter substrate-binding protein n=1 Tax=unclassified Cryobacterium TaxID=2649013 RepID=UPI000B4D81CA|nr:MULTISPECIES: iron ABC transporter substrate-binding protein [unclassified Cryobacterium]ASD22530.1 iron ABC transporter substrate-binding protein [Cryobacterium sp. LW097]TFC51078.1 iron ABC transporter substrate-binding protein [Cryobacterium sp. TMB3-1-2]TFC57511.1 iron ABC transporter substrate-binding protein [Cryobacterium sp. TMB1-7]TFC74424.1 iron ABC transporter substrate-binding protein [Cryobacterium sp. TMB3-15]TFC79937.1 iron ABC transporter substrate-binding protein [Cryobacte